MEVISPSEAVCLALLKNRLALHHDLLHDLLKALGIEHDQLELTRDIARITAGRETLAALKLLPFAEQKSDAWLALRKTLLTASDLAQAVGEGKFGTRKALLQAKSDGAFKSLDCDLAPLEWGCRFEPIAGAIYSRRFWNIGVHEFGLIQHPTFTIFGASPDGINELGQMLEIKCPYRRKPDGTVPRQYWLQIQGQLEVCDLEICHYIECVFEELHCDDYWAEVDKCEDMGIVLKFKNKIENKIHYEYLDHELRTNKATYLAWRDAHLLEAKYGDLVKQCFWRLKKIDLIKVTRNREAWAAVKPQIEAFWEEVLALRQKNAEAIETANSGNSAGSVTSVRKKRAKKIAPEYPPAYAGFSLSTVDDEDD